MWECRESMNRKLIHHQHLPLFALALAFTFAITRITLFVSPHLNVNFGLYNIHHAYLGVILLIFITLFYVAGFNHYILALLAGVGSALFLDQLVFLVATDGGDLTYLGSVSFWGGVVSVVLVLATTGILYYFRKK